MYLQQEKTMLIYQAIWVVLKIVINDSYIYNYISR